MKKILLLEDEEVLGRVYKKKLEAAGFDVLWTTTVDDTEASLRSYDADVVLLDHGIRGHEKAGVELIGLVRELHPDAKIVMLSNYSHLPLQKEARSAGAHAYLIKINTNPQQLIQFIEGLFKEER